MPAAASVVRPRGVPDLVPAPTEGLRRWHRPSAGTSDATAAPEGATPLGKPGGVEFQLLGPLVATGPSGPIDLGGPRQRAALALLLLQAGRVVSLDRLIDDVWSGLAPPSAVTTIRGYLSHLRDALGPGIVVTERPGYKATVDPDRIDAVRFERLVAEGRATTDPAAASAVLRDALSLWRGPALAEFADLPGVLPHAQRLEELHLTAVEAWHDTELHCGRHTQLVGALQAAVAEQPLREQRWRQLMLAYYRCGRQAEALRAYQDVREVLAEELGLEPGPELTALEAAILQQRPELTNLSARMDGGGPRVGSTPKGVGRAAKVADQPGRVISPPAESDEELIGRRRERAELASLLHAALQGRGGLALVSGEAGMGKTRLVADLAAGARRRGVRVTWGHCPDGADAPPYWPWVEALRSLRRPNARAGHEECGLAALVGYDNDDNDDDPDARFRLFDAVATVLAGEAEAGGLVVVLEDLQWADRTSLLLLEFVARRLPPTRVMIVATARPGDMAPEDRARVAGAAALDVPLAGLDRAEAAALLSAGSLHPPPELVERLHRRSGGNPFILRELARLSPDEALDEEFPPTVRRLMLRRCDGLAPAARRLLQVAAVMGPQFGFDALTRVAGAPAPSVLDALDDALARGILAEDRPVGTYRFVHEAMGDALRGEQSRHRRAFVHRAVAEALDRPAAPAAELARHYCAAIPAGADIERAVTWTLMAARRSVDALAYEAAAAQCARALDALEGTGVRPLLRVRLLLALGDACWRAGDVQRARDRFLDAVEPARACDDPSWLARAVLGVGGGLLRDWHATTGECRGQLRGLLEEALDRMGPADSELRVRLLGHLAEESYFDQPDESRRALSAEAVAGARRLGRPSTLGFALLSRILAIWDPDSSAERQRLAQELVVVAAEVGSAELALSAHHHLMVAALELGDAEGAWASLDRLEELAASHRLPLHQWTAAWLRALQVLFAGDLAGAEELAGAAFELGERAHDPDAFNIFATQIGLIRLEQGRAAEVVDTIEALAAEFPELPSLEVARCLLQAEGGCLDQARAGLTRLCTDGLARLPHDFSRLASLAMLAETCCLLGDADAAGVVYRSLLPYRGRFILAGDRHCWGSAEHYLGVLAATRGERARAARHFEAALAAHARMGARPWLAHTQAAYGRLLDAEGDPRARRLLREAKATARSLGMTRLRRRLG